MVLMHIRDHLSNNKPICNREGLHNMKNILPPLRNMICYNYASNRVIISSLNPSFDECLDTFAAITRAERRICIKSIICPPYIPWKRIGYIIKPS